MSYTSYQRVGFGGYHLTPWVKRLLLVNGAVFLLMLPVGRTLVWDLFGLQPSRFLVRPWGVFTYMFVHADFWHVFFNMLALFFFGPPVEDRWGSDQFIKFYLVAGLGAAAFSFLFPGGTVIGASGAVYGVMLAFAMNWPDSPIYIWGIFPVKAKWLVGFFFVASLLGAFGSPAGGVAHLAHLGGLVTGFVYLKTDWRLPGWLGGGRGGKGKRMQVRLAIVPREEAARKKAAAGRSGGTEASDGWSAADEEALLDRVDEVLDKIRESGMESLTAEERSVLDEASRRHRTN